MILKLLAVQAILAPAQGDVPERPPAVAEYDGAAGQLEIATPRLEDPDINIDGRLDDAAWEGAALLRNFSQYDPVEGIPAVQPTEALVLVSDDAIYFGVRAYDSDPGGVRASLSERDSWGRADDYIRVVLDTFNDRRRAYNFMVNAYGVQQDGIWVEGGQGGGG
ncbi:MAG: carbohydrate binding family 9 domain-containing protein, partial [Gammaproteobacteria bacterium]|nr:carbohydrate binding family 9 domain-containing protein [Gammaproteobacteria bacterium]